MEVDEDNSGLAEGISEKPAPVPAKSSLSVSASVGTSVTVSRGSRYGISADCLVTNCPWVDVQW